MQQTSSRTASSLARPARTALGRLAALGLGTVLAPLAAADSAAGGTPPPPADRAPLTSLSLEELMDVEVTTVTRRPQRLVESASAVQVITGDDIRRSGATNLPEALRLAPNLQVAQVNGSQWAISSRGFTNVLSNKLLVLIDGRAVYTPMYAGVFWDVQNVLLEDVERIEVVSGPGGTLWGANAINGVINVISKSARETQGTYASVAVGSAQRDALAVRSGGTLGKDVYLRAYGQRFDRAETRLASDGETGAGDDWGMSQGGFRLDWEPGATDRGTLVDTVTFQGDIYQGDPNPEGDDTPVEVSGGNVLGRWTHAFGERSSLQIQGYADRTFRDFGSRFTEQVDTVDVDIQHRFPIGGRNDVVWGVGCRQIKDREENLPLFGFYPGNQTMRLYSGFVQDEATLVEDRLKLTLGIKLEHNHYTGLEHQPGGRLAWTPTRDHTLWASLSRAVRTPSRIDTDFSASLAPGLVLLQGSQDFRSETLLAYEAGWRVQAAEVVALSVAGFYNQYDHLRSAEPGPPPLGIPITIANGVAGNTYGVEVSGEVQAASFWHLRGGYTFLRKRLQVKDGSADLNDASVESDDPEGQVVVQSGMLLPGGLEFDAVVRYVDALPEPFVSSYTGVDLRLACKPVPGVELAVVGQNLVDDSHVEFRPTSPTPRAIPRSVYGSIAVRW